MYARATRLYGCIATEYLLDTRLSLVLQPKVSLKTHLRTCFKNHVTLHVTHKVDEWPTT